jgi:hypothetical protein
MFYFTLKEKVAIECIVSVKTPGMYVINIEESEESGWQLNKRVTFMCYGATLEKALRYSKTQMDCHLYEVTQIDGVTKHYKSGKSFTSKTNVYKYIGLVKDHV